MDSGNSGSLQSSSGGDDEAAGADSSPLAALLRTSQSPSAGGGFGSFYGFQELTPAPPPQAEHAVRWLAPFPAGAGAPSSSSSHAVLEAAASGSLVDQAGPAAAAAAAAAAGPPPPRGSRKRSRASRRAPTTVLTTDTSNFRAMVQEFTGIPSPPFAAGGGALHSRFDHLFHSPASFRSAGTGATSLPPYLLRPFAQKLNPSLFPPFAPASSCSLSSSNIGIANISTATTTASANPSTTAAAGDNYKLASPSLLGMQDPSSYLPFHNAPGPHLGAATKYTSNAMLGAVGDGGFSSASRPQEPADPFLVAGGTLGLAHGLMDPGGLHLHPRSRRRAGDDLSGLIGDASGSGGTCKIDYSSTAASAAVTISPAERNAEKTPSAAAAAAAAVTRGEGAIDSWLCTSE